MDLLTACSWNDEPKHRMNCYMKQADWDKKTPWTNGQAEKQTWAHLMIGHQQLVIMVGTVYISHLDFQMSHLHECVPHVMS